MKEYLVTIQRIKEITMTIEGKNKKSAINKAKKLVNGYVNNDVDINKIFTFLPFYEFKAKYINKRDAKYHKL